MGSSETTTTTLQPSAQPTGSATWESRFGFLFGIILLVVAGGTATTVGFKVKQAQIVRQADLKNTFYTLAGAPGEIENAAKVIPLKVTGASVVGSPVNGDSAAEVPEQRTFIAAYQLNEWVRKIGLFRTLQELEPKAVVDALQSLSTLGATEVYNTTLETWALLHDVDEAVLRSAPPSLEPPTQPNSSKARRIARRYDRSFMRDVETKLYHYLHQHSVAITGKPAHLLGGE